MIRKLTTVGVAVAAMAVALVGLGGVASATSTPVQLILGQGPAFAILGASCGGIQEQVFVTGFDPATGYPTGVVNMKTTCGGSGRGGGYHTHTYTASAGVEWDFTSAVVSSSVPVTGTVDPAFSATDVNGNQIYNSGGRAYLLLAPGYTPVPRVTSLSVNQGPSSGGTSVVITGTGLTGATSVSFGGTPAAGYTVTGDSSITAVSPMAPAGTGDVTVTTIGGTATTGLFDLFTFVDVPTITGLSPSSGPLGGGNEVTITGTGLAKVSSILFGDQPTYLTAQSDTSLTVAAPPGDAVDTVSVTVTSIGGTSVSGPASTYAYLATDPCGAGCAFTSPASASAGFGVPLSFTVSATGGVTPTFTEKGRLPRGVTFTDNGDGTATISGTPVAGRRSIAHTYKDKITATFSLNGVTTSITQALALTVS